VIAVCASAIDGVVARSRAVAARIEDTVAKTPGGWDSHLGTAPPIWFEHEARQPEMTLTAKSPWAGPVPLLTMVRNGPRIMIAPAVPQLSRNGAPRAGEAVAAVAAGLEKLARRGDAIGCAGQEAVLWDALHRAASLLVVPDADERLARMQKAANIDRRRCRGDKRHSVTIWRGGAPGLGKRS
jgi:hypothetical protein